jgi:hypothetical protein
MLEIEPKEILNQVEILLKNEINTEKSKNLKKLVFHKEIGEFI